MAKLRYIYHRGYDFGRALPFVRSIHGFVLDKPSQIYARLLETGGAAKSDFESPAPIQERDLAAIHQENVMQGLRSSRGIAAAAELPPLAFLPSWVARNLIVHPQLRACGGTATSLARAAHGDWVFHLSGGFHHARPDLSHGFCFVNDVAWGVHAMREAGIRRRILVLDLDLHQGDGNAAFFRGDDDVFTASLHEEHAFPIPKLPSDLDRGLPGGTDDDMYFEALEELLDAISARFEPEVVVYVAGTDPYEKDALGSFVVSRAGMRQRDVRVAEFTRSLGAGLVALPAGGYSRDSPVLSADGFAAMARVFARQ